MPSVRVLLSALLALTGCIHGAEQFRIEHDAEGIARRQAFTAGPTSAPPAPVNVVLIVADDLGLNDSSLAPSGRGLVDTPNLARLAAGGVHFTQATVTSPICSPSRAALLTGRYQQRFGHEGQPQGRYARNLLEYFIFRTFIATGDWRLERPVSPAEEDIARQGLPPSEVTLADVLRRAGLATAAVGKWHLGENEPFQPHRRGFETHVGYYEAYTLYARDLSRPDIVSQRHRDFSDRFIWGKGRTGGARLVRNGVPFEDDGYLTDTLVDEAVDFIDRHQHRNFFLYLALPNPHTPFQAKRALYDRFPDEPDRNRRVYKALIAGLDEAVGQVLDALEARGLEDDTLVIFLSDNGGALYTEAADNRPLLGGKATLFEGGLRVPMAMRWPRRLPRGLTYTAPVSSLDVLPTVAAAAGAPLPDGVALDGVDLLPFLTRSAGEPHPFLFWRSEYAHGVRQGQWKLVRDTLHGGLALYDLDADPGEQVDLSAREPAKVKALLDAFETWNRGNVGPLWPHVMEYRFQTDDGRPFWFPM